MADRKNLSRPLGRGVGGAASNTDNAWFIDLGNGTFAETHAAYQFVKQSGVWVAWDGSTRETVGMIPKVYDYISYTATSSTVDTYVYKSGGSGGTTVATLTVTWSDSTHTTLSSIART